MSKRKRRPPSRPPTTTLRQGSLHDAFATQPKARAPAAAAPAPPSAPAFLQGSWNGRAARTVATFLRTWDASATDPSVLLVWGPNGTGKTLLVERAIRAEMGEDCSILRIDAVLERRAHPAAFVRQWAADHRRRGVVWLDDLPHAGLAPVHLKALVAAIADGGVVARTVVACDDRYLPAMRPLARCLVEARLFAPRADDLIRIGFEPRVAREAHGDIRQAQMISAQVACARDRKLSVFDECAAALRPGESGAEREANLPPPPPPPSDMLVPFLFENYPNDFAEDADALDALSLMADSFSAADAQSETITPSAGTSPELPALAARCTQQDRSVFASALRFPERDFFQGHLRRQNQGLPLLARKLRLASSIDLNLALRTMTQGMSIRRMREIRHRYGLTAEDVQLIRECINARSS